MVAAAHGLCKRAGLVGGVYTGLVVLACMHAAKLLDSWVMQEDMSRSTPALVVEQLNAIRMHPKGIDNMP